MFWKKNLTFRLASTFLGVGLVAIVILGSFALLVSTSVVRYAVGEQLNTVADLKARELQRWFDDQRDEVETLARSQVVKDLTAELIASPQGRLSEVRRSLRQLLDPVVIDEGRLSEIFIMDSTGKVVFSTQPFHEGESHTQEQFFTAGLNSVFVQHIYASPVTLKPEMTVAAPLNGDSGTLGVIAAHVNLQRLDEIVLEQSELGSTSETYLIDSANEFVSSQRFGRANVTQMAQSQGIEAALSGSSGVDSYTNYAGQPVIGAYRWLDNQQLALITEISQAEALAPARRVAWIITGVGMVVGLISMLLIVLLARQITRPIAALTRSAAQVAAGDLSVQAEILSNDEIGTLAKTFNTMTSQLQQLYTGMEEKVAELAQTQAQLQQSEESYRSFIDSAPEGLFQVTASGTWLRANPALAELAGFRDPIQFTAEVDWSSLYVDTDARQQLIRLLDEHGEVRNFETRFYRQDGNIIWVSCSARAVYDEQRKVRYYEGLVQDVTARKEAEAAVASYRERLEEQVEERTRDLRLANQRMTEVAAELRDKNLHLQRGLALAHDIQLGMLPDLPPWDTSRLQAFGRSLPSDEVGGDFYAFLQFNPNHIAVAIGDISGKGVGAALMMALTISTLEERARLGATPAILLQALERNLKSRLKANAMNAALLYLSIDLQTNTVHAANAGMIAPLYIHNRQVSYLDVAGMPLGTDLFVPRNEVSVTLQPGDSLLLISDGVVEAHNNQRELWGFERLEAAIIQHLDQATPQLTVDAILQEVALWMQQADQHDDITLVWLHVPDEAERQLQDTALQQTPMLQVLG